MRKLNFCSMIMLVVMVLPIMLACSKDDENDYVNGLDKHIIKMIVKQGDLETRTLTYTYDGQGKLIKYTDSTLPGYVFAYSYVNNQITLFTKEGGYFGEYHLNEGRIIYADYGYKASPNSMSFKYDNNGYLLNTYNIGISSPYMTYKWTGGNLTQIEGANSSKVIIEYTNYPRPKHYMIFRSNIWIIRDELMAGGFLGKSPRNLIKKITYVNNLDEVEKEITYNYTIEDGYPTRVEYKTVTKTYNEEGWYTYIWNI